MQKGKVFPTVRTCRRQPVIDELLVCLVEAGDLPDGDVPVLVVTWTTRDELRSVVAFTETSPWRSRSDVVTLVRTEGEHDIPGRRVHREPGGSAVHADVTGRGLHGCGFRAHLARVHVS